MANPSVVFATAGYDHTIRFWDATTGVCSRTLQFRESAVNKLDLTSDKNILAAAGNPVISLFNVASPNLQPIMNYEGHNNNVMAVGFQKESRWMFSASEDGTVKVWDLRAQGAQQECEAGAPINYAVLHPNELEILSVDQGGSIRVWDLAANACSCELVPDGDTPMRSISVSSDGYLVVAANNKGVCYVWRRGPQGFEPFHKLQAHSEYILKCLLSPDGRTLATTSSDTTVKLWSVMDNFQLQTTLSEHKKWVWDCVYSVDAAYLVTSSSDCTAKLWDLSVGSAIRSYSGHQKACVCCALNDSAL